MVTLEEILQKHFNCKVPFRKDGTLTTTGEKAVIRLFGLLNDLDLCGILESVGARREINNILTNKFYNP